MRMHGDKYASKLIQLHNVSMFVCLIPQTLHVSGETGGDVFILMRGELHMLDLDLETKLFRIPEGTVFGEGYVLRHLEVRRSA
jgi:hypothetical protein